MKSDLAAAPSTSTGKRNAIAGDDIGDIAVSAKKHMASNFRECAFAAAALLAEKATVNFGCRTYDGSEARALSELSDRFKASTNILKNRALARSY